MGKYELENSNEFKVAQELEDALNNMSWNSEKFAESVVYYHRTLQQKLFYTIVNVIEMIGIEDYADPQRRTDLRNEASKEGAKKLMEVLEELHIPFI